MPDFTLYFDCEPTADAARLKTELQAGVQKNSKVASAETSETTARFTGVEILAAVTLAAGLVHQSVGIVHDVRAIVEDLKVIFKDVSAFAQRLHIKKVRVPVGMEPKPIDELTDADYEVIAQDIITERQENAPTA